MTEERLRHTLIPQYQQLFSKIGRLEGGVKFLVDMRADILVRIFFISFQFILRQKIHRNSNAMIFFNLKNTILNFLEEK